jgi:hypothetical protein
MKSLLERLIKLTGQIKTVEAVADAPHRRRGHVPEATTRKGLAGPLVRKGIPAVVIGSLAVAGLRHHWARHQARD